MDTGHKAPDYMPAYSFHADACQYYQVIMTILATRGPELPPQKDEHRWACRSVIGVW